MSDKAPKPPLSPRAQRVREVIDGMPPELRRQLEEELAAIPDDHRVILRQDAEGPMWRVIENGHPGPCSPWLAWIGHYARWRAGLHRCALVVEERDGTRHVIPLEALGTELPPLGAG